MVYYTHCCYALKSKTAAKTMAILGVIFTGLSLLGTSIAFGVIIQQDIHIGELSENSTSVLTDVLEIPYTLSGEYHFKSQVWIVFQWTIAVQALYLTIFAMLLNGIEKASCNLMFPFLVIDMIGLFVSTSSLRQFTILIFF